MNTKQIRSIFISLLFSMSLLFIKPAVAQYEFCERMADNSIQSFLTTEVKGNSFVFFNQSKHTISFYYSGVKIQLDAKSKSSQSFTGRPPRSLDDCRVDIDNVPIKNYYDALAFENEYQSVSAMATTGKGADYETPDELNNHINILTKTLNQLEANRRLLPSWFTSALGYELHFTQLNAWISRHNSAKANSKPIGKVEAGQSGNLTSAGTNGSPQHPATTNKSSVTSQNSSSTKINNGGQKQQDLDAERKKAESAVQQVNQVLEDRVQAQREYDRTVNESAEAFGSLAGTFAAGIMEHKDAKDARELRAMEYKQQNEEKGKILVTQFMPIALKGDEKSIEKVIQGYSLTGEASKRETFLLDVLQKHNSVVAYSVLKRENETIISSFVQENKKYKRRAISNFIWSGIVAGGGYYLYDQMIEKDNFSTGDSDLDVGVSTVAGVGGVVGGLWLLIASLSNLGEIGTYKKDPYYHRAVSILELLQKRKNNKTSLSIQPSFSPMFNQPMLGLKLKF